MNAPRTALNHLDTFTAYLKERLPHRRLDSLRCVAEVLFGIIQSESSLHRKIAHEIDRPHATIRMVARVFHGAGLSQQDVLDVLLPLLPEGKLTVVMDRTFLGRTDTHEDACPLLRQRNHTLRYEFIRDHHPEYRLDLLCRVLEVSVSGYHSWRRRPICNRKQENALLEQRIQERHRQSKRRYGAPRIHAELQVGGVRVSRKRVARLMRIRGLRAKGKRRWVQTTDGKHTLPGCPNLLARQFEVQQPN